METSLLGWIFRMKILEWGGDRKSRGSNSLQSEPLQLAVGVQRLRTVTTSPALPSPRFLQTPWGSSQLLNHWELPSTWGVTQVKAGAWGSRRQGTPVSTLLWDKGPWEWDSVGIGQWRPAPDSGCDPSELNNPGLNHRESWLTYLQGRKEITAYIAPAQTHP